MRSRRSRSNRPERAGGVTPKVKIKVLEKDVLSLVQDVAKKLKAGEITTAEASARGTEIVADHPEIFSVAKGHATGPTTATAGVPMNWSHGGDAEDRNGAAAAAVSDQDLIQKCYEAVIKSPVGGAELDQINDKTSQAEHQALHDLHDGFTLCAAMRPGYNPRHSKHWNRYSRLAGKLTQKVAGENRVRKILTTGGSLTGADFIPNTMSASLIPFYRQALMLGQLFNHGSMPTSPYILPFEGIDINPYLVAEASDDNVPTTSNQIPARTPATGKITLTAAGLKVRSVVSSEVEEDAIISMVAYVRPKIGQAIANGVDDNIVNGDTSGTHMDADSNTTSDWRHAWLGLRKLTAAGTTKFDNGQNKLTVAKLLNVKRAFGKFGQVPSDQTFIMSQIGFIHICGDTAFARWDAIGQTPPLVNGQVGTLYGTPVVVSGYVRDNLNGNAVYDGSSTTNTMALLVHRPSFMMWDRRTITIDAMKDIQTDKFTLVATWRGTFARMQAEQTSPSVSRNVGYVYNIGTTQTF